MTLPRMTTTTVHVLETFAADPTQALYGLEVMAQTALASGTVFPILARFEQLGWLQSGWEAVEPSSVGRPRRRYYRLTEQGAELTQEALARVHAERRQRRSLLRPAAGVA